MHIALLDHPSRLLEENVRSASLGQAGVICAHCCQTTSKRSVTFGELEKDFYLHAKFNLGTKILQNVSQQKLSEDTEDTKTKP